ncbi:MAG: hypothetical protein FH748_11655 [Balneolaceae bacterium]|nr:hypothetical protein [Balneolaceae bacterium]
MIKILGFRFVRACIGLTICSFLFINTVAGQDQKVNLEIELGAALESAQVLSLTSLGVDKDGAGPVLVTGLMENLTNKKLENLYLEIKVTASQYGTIVELTQESSSPFSLDPLETIYATNNDLADSRIPGIDEEIRFTGGLTSEGDRFINSLEGSTTLPADIYSVHIQVIQVTNMNGREVLATSTVQIGRAKTFESSEIYLRSPGNDVGDGAEITNSYPQFSWEGENDITYRLLVVKSNGQDGPETLLGNAADSPAIQSGGSLLQFENLDVLVDGNSYQYPAFGAQKLEEGQQYYWRVLTTLRTSNGTEQRSSEIWSFKISGGSDTEGTTKVPLNEDVNEALTQLLGDSEFSRLIEDGYALEGIEIDGQVVNGLVAAQLLREIMQKIRDGDIIIAEDQ